MLTGDDGNGGATATTTIHNKVQRNEFIDNGDGLELTRGAAFNLDRRQYLPLDRCQSRALAGHRGAARPRQRHREQPLRGLLGRHPGQRRQPQLHRLERVRRQCARAQHDRRAQRDRQQHHRRQCGRRRAAPRRADGHHARDAQHHPPQRPGVLRCWSGGSCDPKLRRGGIMFGIPAQEHAAYVGERGGGVPVDPAKFTHICPEGAPACQASRTTGSRRRCWRRSRAAARP